MNLMQRLIFLLLASTVCALAGSDNQPRPNVLWVTAEDITTMLGAYGDSNAHTPNLDRFAERSIRFTRAFATAPVCSPARSCLVTSQYATSLGTQNLRSEVEIPRSVIPYPKYLRQAGIYAVNNDKEDYNFVDPTIWDESSNTAHWKNRPEGVPFFSIFNLGITHQSRIFGDDAAYAERIAPWMDVVDPVDPASLELPPYYPDTPVVRKLWARYYTNVAIMDHQFGDILAELEAAGLKEDTIVFFYSDHGTGMPRAKRALYDSGLRVPLLVHVPERWARAWGLEMGTTDERPVSFLDYAPTLLSLFGLETPPLMEGRAFLGPFERAGRPFVFGASDRVDEAFEVARTVRSRRYRYVRNYLPHLPLLQPNYYTDQSAIMAELFRVREERDTPMVLFRPRRAPEELYDLEADPHELNNLAGDPRHREALEQHRSWLREKVLRSRDTGFMFEPVMLALAEKHHTTPYAVAHDPALFPLARILEAADLVLQSDLGVADLRPYLLDSQGLVRLWALLAAEGAGLEEDPAVVRLVEPRLSDPMAMVRIQAAKFLVKAGRTDAVDTILAAFDAENEALLLFAARAFEEISGELTEIPVEAVAAHRRWEEETAGQWYGYKLYASWAMRQALGER